MPFPHAHYLFSFGGKLRTVDEQWTMGLRFPGDFSLSDQAGEQDLQDDLTAVLAAWWPNGISGAPAHLEWTKFNRIGTDGKYVNNYSNTQYVEPGVPGGFASNYPNQIALVVTLETGLTRGLAHRGRLFFPTPRFNIEQATGKVAVGSMQTIADTVTTLLDNLNTACAGLTGPAAPVRVSVASNVREGAFRPVTGVSVGDVLDTMRSRRTQLTEVRAVADLAAAP